MKIPEQNVKIIKSSWILPKYAALTGRMDYKARNTVWEAMDRSKRASKFSPIMRQIEAHRLSRFLKYKYLFQAIYEAELKKSFAEDKEMRYFARVDKCRMIGVTRILDLLNFL